MALLEKVKNRISSVKSTCQITSAMKIVASVKLHKTQGRVENVLPCQRKLNGILTDLLSTDVTTESPYIDRRPVGRVAIVALLSNSSLCGTFSSNVAEVLGHTLEECQSLGRESTQIYPVGKRMEEAVKRLRFALQSNYRGVADKPSYMQVHELAGTLIREFLEGRVDKAELIYHHSKSTGSQILTRDEHLPINLDKVIEEATESTIGKSNFNNDYIVEPSAAQLITELLPKALNQKVHTVLLNSNALEYAVWVFAMQAATDNTNESIQDLTKQHNKSRQQTITSESLDIIGGSTK